MNDPYLPLLYGCSAKSTTLRATPRELYKIRMAQVLDRLLQLSSPFFFPTPILEFRRFLNTQEVSYFPNFYPPTDKKIPLFLLILKTSHVFYSYCEMNIFLNRAFFEKRRRFRLFTPRGVKPVLIFSTYSGKFTFLSIAVA